MVENCEQRIYILCNTAFRFNELNALLASTPGFLLRVISRHATRASTECGSTISDASNLVNRAICFLSSLPLFLNLRLLRIC